MKNICEENQYIFDFNIVFILMKASRGWVDVGVAGWGIWTLSCIPHLSPSLSYSLFNGEVGLYGLLPLIFQRLMCIHKILAES